MQKVGTSITVGVGRRGECLLMEDEEGSLEEIRFQLGSKVLKEQRGGGVRRVYISTLVETHGGPRMSRGE